MNVVSVDAASAEAIDSIYLGQACLKVPVYYKDVEICLDLLASELVVCAHIQCPSSLVAARCLLIAGYVMAYDHILATVLGHLVVVGVVHDCDMVVMVVVGVVHDQVMAVVYV